MSDILGGFLERQIVRKARKSRPKQHMIKSVVLGRRLDFLTVKQLKTGPVAVASAEELQQYQLDLDTFSGDWYDAIRTSLYANATYSEGTLEKIGMY